MLKIPDHGVHTGVVKENWEEVLSNFRFQFLVSLERDPDGQEIPCIGYSMEAKASDIRLNNYDPRALNGVLLELHATFHFLVSSPDIQHLAQVINEE